MAVARSLLVRSVALKFGPGKHIWCRYYLSIIRPPVYGSNGRSYKMLVMFSFFLFLGRPEPPFRTGLYSARDVSFFFVSPLVLQAPSTDRPETLPHGRNVAEFF